jgi:hypothetical protein
MLRRVKIVFLLAAAAGCAARGPGVTGAGHIRDAPGTVQRVGDFGYGLVPDSDAGTRYAPDRLPAEFQTDGLRVVFSGEVQPPPANARLWGTPLRLTAIRRASSAGP